jgi:TolB protein
MKVLARKRVLALLLIFAVGASASAAGRGRPATPRPAGPWYTPKELGALEAYSNASFEQKQAILAGAGRRSFRTANGLLAYDAKIAKHYQLFTSNADGTAARQLTDFADSDAVWAAWSPSGDRIAFERDVYTGVFVNHAAIYTMNADGTGQRSLTPTGLNGQPSWSPNGKLIVFSTLQFGKQATISVMTANGRRTRKLLTTPLPCKRCYGAGLGSATFSPDGKRIAFVWHKNAVAAIFTLKASGGDLEQVTPWQRGGLADKIDWSPDGARIAFSSPGIGDRPGISSNVFTVRPDGGGLVKLTNSRGGKINNGLDSWSPDGKKLAFVSNRNGTYEIYVMNANGSGVQQVTRGPEAHRASWGTHP